MNFKNFIKSFLVISILLICQPVYAITINASRTTGVAPLSVHFYDADVSVSTPSARLFHDREYDWDFGDSSGGTWGTDGESKNTAKGAVTAHVFETPGNHTVTLTVRDETGIIGTDTEVITVTDPDTVYAGTLTTCVCDVANNDFTGCPAGANQVCTDNLSTITGYAGAGERLLFHRGSSWTSGGLSFPNNFGPVSIGAYGTGTGADDLGIYSNAPHMTMTGTFCSMTDKHNWRICDLYLSAADTVGNGISGEMDMQQILMMRLKTVGFSVPVTFTHWKGSASDLIDQVAIVSNDFYSGRDYCMYMGAERLAVLGNILKDAGTSHVLRVWQGYRGVVSHNQLSGSSIDNDAGRQALKLHSPLEHLVDPNGVDLCLNNRSTFVIVSDNVFGSSGPWPVSIGPQNGESDERISDLIFERNYLSGDYGTYNGRPISISLSICGRYFSIRNNIIDGIDGANTYTGITILQRGSEPAPIGVEVYNNTIYKSNSGTYAHIGVEVGLNCTDTIVRNNLASFPNATSTRLVLDDDSADGISSNNLLTDTPGFIDPGNATPLLRDFGLLGTSPAVNQGTTVNLLDDYTGGYRDSGVYDIGAFEYTTNIYVDNTLVADCVTGNYSISSRDCSGSDGDAYIKIQDAINAMSIGDTIYIRGGTYNETNTSLNEMINIPDSKNGDSWEPGHFNTLASYPGEWAIIDGEYTAPKGVILGNKYMSSGGTNYWVFERLEFYRGSSPGSDDNGGAGLWIAEGPVKIRYCYFNNCWDDSQLNNPSGLTVYRLENSTIEYNYFYHNGCASGSNCSQVAIYSDYDWAAWISDWNSFTIDHATRKNEWRYNYFVESAYGLKDKGIQMLSQIEGIDLTYREFGDKVHHNIFKDQDRAGVLINQDFKQIYNNIFDNTEVNDGEGNSSFRVDPTTYNNTIIDSAFRAFGYNSYPYVPKDQLYNNIITNSPSSSEVKPVIAGHYGSNSSDASNSRFLVSNNYFYNITSTTNFFELGIGHSGSYTFCGNFTVSEFDTEYGFTNYSKATSEGSDNLFQGSTGADQYITRGSHSAGSVTISDGGRGGDHPYLSGVTIPTYVGATNPSDNGWVDGVLTNLTSTTWLRSTTTDRDGDDNPTWIEGTGAAPPPPAGRGRNIFHGIFNRVFGGF